MKNNITELVFILDKSGSMDCLFLRGDRINTRKAMTKETACTLEKFMNKPAQTVFDKAEKIKEHSK